MSNGAEDVDMSLRAGPLRATAPRVVVTGFTSAFLGDERTLREFIVGDHVRREYLKRGESAALYLVNDSYDALTTRQLRVGLGKESPLLADFESFQGRPIAEVPDPFGCHESYSEHFMQALERRLHALDIHPVVLDTYRAYRAGYYTPFLAVLFENYEEIRRLLAEEFPEVAAVQRVFRPQCVQCQRIDTTEIRRVEKGSILFHCERCAADTTCDVSELRGKLSWKLDCAARWNIYGADCETFAKAHFEDLGTFGVARFMSSQYFGGRIPRAIQYGNVQIDREMSHKILEILPPPVLKAMFTHRRKRDLVLTRDFVENFCQKHEVRPGVSYVDFVRKELPRELIRRAGRDFDEADESMRPDGEPGGEDLATFGNRFARCLYGRDHRLTLPDESALASCAPETLRAARHAVLFATSLRMEEALPEEEVRDRMRIFLRSQDVGADLYRFLRTFFRQEEGLNVVTFLALLPPEHLRVALILLTQGESYTSLTTAPKVPIQHPQIVSQEIIVHGGKE